MKMAEICVAVMANVDAGKTTLIEQMLKESGTIRCAGRVDHGDSFLDNHQLERKRGITIFSKMARLSLKEKKLVLLDTPGHVDFSAEAERTLQIADCAVLLISASDLVTGHTLTLWSLLKRSSLPVMIFVNKMDMPSAGREEILKSLRENLDEQITDFSGWAAALSADKRALAGADMGSSCSSFSGTGQGPENQPALKAQDTEAGLDALYESCAMCDEAAMDSYLEKGFLTDSELRGLYEKRLLFPLFFGSALKEQGVVEFLNALYILNREKELPDRFGARCYKISHDEKGNRLTWLKITGGSLKVRSLIAGNESRSQGTDEDGENDDETKELMNESSDEPVYEKVNQIRLYSGLKFSQTDEALAGQLVAVTGPDSFFCGQTFGDCKGIFTPAMEPVLSYEISFPSSEDPNRLFEKLRELAEEIPEISPAMDEKSGAVSVRVMGEVQTQILKSIMHDRYGLVIDFSDARIVYKETIESPAEGVGHFEPLRHYAEVHLLLEKGERGSGIVYSTSCPTDVLSRNWQNLALSTLHRHRQLGVLTGSELTDIKVTLLSGRSHIKHTMGGDFRQAARRALRQGLMKCRSVLLEPYYNFSLTIPENNLGRALLDIEQAAGSVEAPLIEKGMAYLKGSAPVAGLQNYHAKVRAYSQGRGSLELTNGGYGPCHNPEKVIEEAAYDPERDLKNPTWSVFCAHGAGFEVPWDKVEEYMHLPLSTVKTEEGLKIAGPDDAKALKEPAGRETAGSYERYMKAEATAAELDAIFERTYGPIRRRINDSYTEGLSDYSRRGGGRRGPEGLHKPVKKDKEEEYLLVDGYNIIFAWDDLKDLAGRELSAARTKLADLLSNYQGYHRMNLILVFDAYRVEGGVEHTEKYHNIYIVYTKEAETADRYIERAVHRTMKGADLTVATSDQAEQIIIWGAGARRMSARELREAIENTDRELRTDYLDNSGPGRNFLFDNLNKEMSEKLERVRLGKESL